MTDLISAIETEAGTEEDTNCADDQENDELESTSLEDINEFMLENRLGAILFQKFTCWLSCYVTGEKTDRILRPFFKKIFFKK